MWRIFLSCWLSAVILFSGCEQDPDHVQLGNRVFYALQSDNYDLYMAQAITGPELVAQSRQLDDPESVAELNASAEAQKEIDQFMKAGWDAVHEQADSLGFEWSTARYAWTDYRIKKIDQQRSGRVLVVFTSNKKHYTLTLTRARLLFGDWKLMAPIELTSYDF